MIAKKLSEREWGEECQLYHIMARNLASMAPWVTHNYQAKNKAVPEKKNNENKNKEKK